MSVFIFKPDEIGDFVLATGAIRLLVREHGENRVTLAVKSEIAPLARREFPDANIVELPWQPRRKGRNQAAENLRHCFPAWRRLRALRVDAAVCLRSRRDYIQSLLFAAPRATNRFASENVLALQGRWRRRFAEALFLRWSRPRMIPYPSSRGVLPDELASHRAVVAAALGREVGEDEIMPSLGSVRWRGGGGWLLCPFSSRRAKDYSVERWCAVLGEAARSGAPRAIRLAGGPDQSARLHEFADSVRSAGLNCPVEVVPRAPLDSFPDIVATADLVLTVDTAAAHFACACRAPAVIVACGLHDGTYGPYSPDGRQVWLVGDWAGSGRDGWQNSVPPGDVAAAIRNVTQP